MEVRREARLVSGGSCGFLGEKRARADHKAFNSCGKFLAIAMIHLKKGRGPVIPRAQSLRRVHWKSSGTDLLILDSIALCPKSAPVPFKRKEGTFSSSCKVPMKRVNCGTTVWGRSCDWHFQRVVRLFRAYVRADG